MDFNKEWRKIMLENRLILPEGSPENIYVPVKGRSIILLGVHQNPTTKDWQISSTVNDFIGLVDIEIPAITDQSFTSKEKAEEFRDFVIDHSNVPKVTWQKSYKKGGRINVSSNGDKFDRERYVAIFGDYDGDGIPNIDDPKPLTKGKTSSTVEKVELHKTFDQLLDLKADLEKTMNTAVDKLDKVAPKGSEIYARTKTPFSIVKKLVEKRLVDTKKGLTDLVGTTIATEDYGDLITVRNQIRKGILGDVIEEIDFYKSPKAGYRAYHFIVLMDGKPIEIQLKTKRMKRINQASHPAYKKGTQNNQLLNELTSLAVKADKGSKIAIKKLDKWFENPEKMKDALDLENTQKLSLGGVILGGAAVYVAYKVGRMLPSKTGFETEKKIAAKTSRAAKSMSKSVKSRMAKKNAHNTQ